MKLELCALPCPLLQLVAFAVDSRTFTRLARTCRRLRRLIQEHPRGDYRLGRAVVSPRGNFRVVVPRAMAPFCSITNCYTSGSYDGYIWEFRFDRHAFLCRLYGKCETLEDLDRVKSIARQLKYGHLNAYCPRLVGTIRASLSDTHGLVRY